MTTEKRIGRLTWVQSGAAWYSHCHQFRLRAKPLSDPNRPRWIVSRETAEGWQMLGNAPTLEAVSAIAYEWVMA